jgi:hypothetical protein
MRRLVVSLLVAVGLASIVYGFAAAKTGDTCITDKATIERVEPSCDDHILRQSEVGVDFVAGVRGTLTIDGVVIPTFVVNQAAPNAADRLMAQYDQGTGTLLYTPKPGGQIEAFTAGQHTIVVSYWPIDQPDSTRTFSWTFFVT